MTSRTPRTAARHRRQSFRTLSRAMFLGYVRDRTALPFSILIPVLFLVLLGSIYRNPSTPRITVLEVGRVSLLDQARAAGSRQLSTVMTIGALAKTQQAATSIANLIILPMAFLGGAFVPLDFAPSWMRQVSYLMPLRYLVTGTQDVLARGLGPASALPAIAILLGFTLVLTVAAACLFRWDEI
jgi:ABC-type uncharacterized transport system permease subunit